MQPPSVATAKHWAGTALGLNCAWLATGTITGISGPLWAALGLVIGGVFWIALVAWGWSVYRDRRHAAGGSTAALVRPWVVPLLLIAGTLAVGLALPYAFVRAL